MVESGIAERRASKDVSSHAPSYACQDAQRPGSLPLQTSPGTCRCIHPFSLCPYISLPSALAHL